MNGWINKLILQAFLNSLIVFRRPEAVKCSQRLSFRQFVRRYFVAELGDCCQNVQVCLDTLADVDATGRPKAIGKDKAKTYTVDPQDDTRKQEAEKSDLEKKQQNSKLYSLQKDGSHVQ